MNPHTAIASISTISLVITIITFVALTSVALAEARPREQETQQRHQQSAAAAGQSASTSNMENEDLLRQIMRLAATGQQRADDDNAQIDVPQTLKKQLLASASEQPSKRFGQKARSVEQQKKVMLKRKLHKLVDDLIDESALSSKQGGEFAVNQPVANRRPALKEVGAHQQVPAGYFQPSSAVAANQAERDDQKLVIVVKRKPDGGNGLGDLFASDSQQQQQTRQPVNMEQHHRRILNDDFGILKEAKITSNNHLGLKGMPKFGSEEQF